MMLTTIYFGCWWTFSSFTCAQFQTEQSCALALREMYYPAAQQQECTETEIETSAAPFTSPMPRERKEK